MEPCGFAFISASHVTELHVSRLLSKITQQAKRQVISQLISINGIQQHHNWMSFINFLWPVMHFLLFGRRQLHSTLLCSVERNAFGCAISEQRWNGGKWSTFHCSYA